MSLPTVHVSDALLGRLTHNRRPVVFLVGSALTMPHATGKPGVANVEGVVQLVRNRLTNASGRGGIAGRDAIKLGHTLDQALKRAGTDGGARYQAALELLKARDGGADAMNDVIRDAVLQARKPGAPLVASHTDTRALMQLEKATEDWYLGPAVKSLGLLLAHHPERFGGLVLTTNFDPLVEIAVRAAGGEAMAVEQPRDGALPSTDPVVTSVVHVHGLWRADTLHTPGALTIDRDQLIRSLMRRFHEITLVVIGYGGWDDVLTSALMELTNDSEATPDVLWCFYEREAEEIARRYPKVLKTLRGLRERAVIYAGIDCNTVLPELRRRVDGEHELIGRGALCNELIDALRGEQAVELIGEPKMMRTQLLRWVADQAADLDVRAAYVNAQALPEPTPVALVREVADVLGLIPEVDAELQRYSGTPDDGDAIRALGLLEKTWILVDNADLLAVDGHAFTERFFKELRGKVQANAIHWISVARKPLGPLFAGKGLTSEFLNDAKKIFVGGLDRREVEIAFRARLGHRAAKILELSGTLPRLVCRLCDAEWSNLDEVVNGLHAWAEGLCAQWWQRESKREKLLLKRALDRVESRTLRSQERAVADELCRRGLLVETEDGFAINGGVWGAYVRQQA